MEKGKSVEQLTVVLSKSQKTKKNISSQNKEHAVFSFKRIVIILTTCHNRLSEKWRITQVVSIFDEIC